MRLLWGDYSGEATEEVLPLLISERSQALVLAAMQRLDSRHCWQLDISDAEWDEAHAAIGEAYEEVSREIMPDFTPVGAVMWFPLDAADIPDKWLVCDGSAVSQTTYPTLYNLLRFNFGSGGGTFNLPDLDASFLYGAGNDGHIGATGGAAVVTLTESEMPAHVHDQYSKGGAAGAVLTTAGYLAASAASPTVTGTDTGSKGGGASHENMPPYMRGYWCIKALP